MLWHVPLDKYLHEPRYTEFNTQKSFT